MLRMSTLFVRTLREDPADAEVRSHRLLVRAGYIRRAAPGGYAWLPLGKLVLDRITGRGQGGDGRDRRPGGAVPVADPAGGLRGDRPHREFGPDMFRLTDRRGARYVLAPTHEELFTLLVRDVLSSYRDYPVILYQVHWKYRDEPRPARRPAAHPRAADEGLVLVRPRRRRAGDLVPAAPRGLPADLRAGSASATPSRSARWPVPWAARGRRSSCSRATPARTRSCRCPACGYAANVEAFATRPAEAPTPREHGPLTVLDTPDTPTIETLVDRLNDMRAAGRVDWTAADTLKNVVVTVTPPGGDRNCSRSACPATATSTSSGSRRPCIRPSSRCSTTSPVGRISSRATSGRRTSSSATWSTRASRRAPPGSPAPTSPIGTRSTWSAAATSPRTARSRPPTCGTGDPCPSCGGPLALRRGLELGHIFQLGRRYADVFGLDALGPDSRADPDHDGQLRHRHLASGRRDRRDERRRPRAGVAAQVAPVDVHVLAAGQGPSWTRRPRWPRTWSGPACGCCSTTGPACRPGSGSPTRNCSGRRPPSWSGARFDEGDVEVRDRASGTRDGGARRLD